MALVKSDHNQDLDMEWTRLIMKARQLGYSKEDVQKALLVLKESSKDDIQEAAV
ncbi:protein sinI [Paenibacillus sinopodophylli]|uniref:protein sinI n=1 Tax=Paenibacillus sinopodophylli TaxID=1837342 RepID=UPI00110CCD17|nr:protein sinI [Paenibacillus sinopodophylli]